MLRRPLRSTLFPYTTLFRSYDVDGDGAEDLLIPSGRGGTLAYYRNDHGRLVRVDLHLPPARYDETTVLPLRSEEHTSELQSLTNLVCRLLLEKKKKKQPTPR